MKILAPPSYFSLFYLLNRNTVYVYLKKIEKNLNEILGGDLIKVLTYLSAQRQSLNALATLEPTI